MGPAQSVEPGFFPLDRELGLLPGSLTPGQQEHLVHLGTWMPFARASQVVEKLLGVQVSEATVRRMTERMGVQVEAVQTEACSQPEQEEWSGKSAQKLALSADGAYVPLLKGEWAEGRTLAIGEVEWDHNRQKGQVRHLSYSSRMTSASSFADWQTGRCDDEE